MIVDEIVLVFVFDEEFVDEAEGGADLVFDDVEDGGEDVSIE